MRRSCGVRGLLVYCSDYKCSHYIAISGDRWSDDVRLSDLEPKFTCSACGKRSADIRPDFHWDRPSAGMGYHQKVTGWAAEGPRADVNQ